MTSPYLAVAAKINALWVKCLNNASIRLADCPSDEEVAQIIQQDLSVMEEE